MNHEILKKHNELIIQIADSIDADWRRIVMSYEQEGKPGSLTQDTLLFYIHDTQNGLEKVSVKDPSEESGTGLAFLNTLMADPSGKSWSGCELIIDADGNIISASRMVRRSGSTESMMSNLTDVSGHIWTSIKPSLRLPRQHSCWNSSA